MVALDKLNHKLQRLRWYRWLVAVSAAACALGMLLLGSLALLAAIDIRFELSVVQRATAAALIAAGACWFGLRRVVSGLRWPEDRESVALLVEQRHSLDSDLIAAMQFQRAGHEPTLGSPTLQHAVIQQASALADQLDFFAGVDARPLPLRAWVLTGAVAVTVALAGFYPRHFDVFLRRLQLGAEHYPTRTVLRQLIGNGTRLLEPDDATFTPGPLQCAEGQAIELLVRAGGDLPPEGAVVLDADGQHVDVPLTRMTRRDRLVRLQRALDELQKEHGSWEQAAILAAADAPAAAKQLRQPSPDVAAAVRQLERTLSDMDAENQAPDKEAWYVATLPRSGRDIRYHVELGDAWSEQGAVSLIPLPIVRLEAVAEAPAYSRLGRLAMRPGTRQLRVLEGSQVELSVRCVNDKQLVAVWAELSVDGEPPRRVSLEPSDDGWTLPAAGTSLASVQRRARFAVQVEDQDGLRLPAPLSGQVQVRPDRPPTGGAEVLHRVVLPQAKPTLMLTASDDFGIESAQLRLLVEKPAATLATAEPGVSRSDVGKAASDEGTKPKERVVPLPLPSLSYDSFPWQWEHPLDLAPLQLAKGDRLKITLELVDDRGDMEGQQYRASPLILEVSDEAGVLAAVSEADERAEQKLNELIKKQLGIGEQP